MTNFPAPEPTTRFPSPASILRHKIRDQRLKVADLADASGVSGQYLHHIVSGRAPLGVSAGVRLAMSFAMCHRSLLVAKARYDAEVAARALGLGPAIEKIGSPLPTVLSIIAADEASHQAVAMLKAQHLSARKAAIKAGLPPSRLAQVLSNRGLFSAGTAVSLAHVLGQPLDHFLVLQAASRADAEFGDLMRRQDITPLPAAVRPSLRHGGSYAELHIRNAKS